jgi:flagellar motor switch protein FliN
MTDEQNNDIIQAVNGSVIELFDTMLSMEITPVEEEPETPDDDRVCLVGFVSLAGKVNGSVNIRVSQAMAREMAAGMLGMEIEEIESDEEVKDVLREVCNIVAGGLKSNFCDAGLACQISTPSITTGNNFQIQTLHMERYEKFVFACGDEIICVEIAVKFLAEDESDLHSILKLKKIDISKFQRLDIISSVGDSIIELFDTMLSLEVDLSDREPFQKSEDFRVMGAVDFAGGVHGSIQFQVSQTFARMITAGMLGQELDEVQDIETVKDVIGEMTNILGGNLKAAFCDTGLDCQISTPSLTVGLDFNIEILNMDRYEQFAFKLNDHDILVEVCVKIDEPEPMSSSDTQPQEEETNQSLDDDAIQKMIAAANQEGQNESAPATATSSATPDKEDQKNQTLDDDAIQALLAAAHNDKGDDGGHVEENPATPTTIASNNEGDKAVDRVPPPLPAAAAPATGDKTEATDSDMPGNVSFIQDIPVHIVVELGRTKMNIKDILGLGKGSAIVLSNLEGETLDIRANNRLIAKGEVLVENDKYGIRIKEILCTAERAGRLVA